MLCAMLMMATMNNPVIPGWYADPELHLFNGRYYLYPTYSDLYEKQTFIDGFESEDLVHWTKHPKILDFIDVSWSTMRAAWAPTVTERNGTYYMYFGAGDGAGLGVATSKNPMGPFKDALGHPLIKDYINGAQPIDAHAYIDDDGQAYLYYGGWSHANVVKLGRDMISTEGEFKEITPEHYVEGPFMVKRKGIYYFMWSEGSWGDTTYGVAYAKSKSPLGPFVREGHILSGDPAIGTSAGHHSVMKIPKTDEWYIAYHRRPVGETARDHRVVCIDRLYFDKQGNIVPVKITNEGVKPRKPPIRK